MTLTQWTWAAASAVVLSSTLTIGCQSGGVGDPCTPEDEYQRDFGGYDDTEVNVESRSFQCETRVCLVNSFRGRVSCPYGQVQTDIDNGTPKCWVPGSGPPVGKRGLDDITVPVPAQLFSRRTSETVYCSCRCDGPDASSKYCKCPSGFRCAELVKPVNKFGLLSLAGSYCIKDNVPDYKAGLTGGPCTQGVTDCGNPDGT